MKARTQTLEQLARVLDVDERKVSRTARGVLGLTAAMVRDPALTLSRNHCRRVAQALGRPDPWAAARPFALSSPSPARRPAFRRDPCASGKLSFSSLPHALWVHPDVPDARRDGAASPAIGHRAAAPGRARAHDRGERLPGGGEPRRRPRRLPVVLPARDRGRRPRRPALDTGAVAVHAARRPGASRARAARVGEDDRAVEGGRGAQRTARPLPDLVAGADGRRRGALPGVRPGRRARRRDSSTSRSASWTREGCWLARLEAATEAMASPTSQGAARARAPDRH